ncbi:MAG TPA: FtsX-like permease family protein [Flavisolibacter sp.]|nr:FtsX-like permease family protein [Flavisolibacter sp.]
MFRNYLKTAVRNLLRYKGFAAINIVSLTIGLIGCFAIGLFVWDELQYDRSIEGGESVYRLYDERYKETGTTKQAVVAPAYASFLEQQYPEVDTTLRILMAGDKYLMELGDKRAYEEKGLFAEASFFRLFPLELLKGDAATALASPMSVVLTEELASRYFGKEDPLGKTIKIEKEDFVVTAVMASLPGHFHLRFNYLMSLSSAGLPAERMEKWTWTQFYTYVKLKPGANPYLLQEKFQQHVKKAIYPTLKQEGNTFLPFLQSLRDIHLRSADFIYDNAVRGNHSYVQGLIIIAVFVLVIACFNFVNLATARSFRRAKEIGVRKVVGAERRQLIVQFICETVLLSVLAATIAIVAMFFITPLLNTFTGKAIPVGVLSNPVLLLLIYAGAMVIGMLAGIYPALVLSGFQPIRVLKGMKQGGLRTGWLRQALVVAQFSLSALLIVSSTIVYRQVRHLNSRDLGFNKEQVLSFQIKGDLAQNIETFKTELRRSPNVRSVTSGYGLPGDQFANDNIVVPGNNGGKDYSVSLFMGDHDYIRTLGLQLIAGRDFSRDLASDVSEAFIINETAVRMLGFQTPEKALGQRLDWNKWTPDSLEPVKRGKVIGVVKDFHYKSLHEKVAASVIQIYPPMAVKVAVKLTTVDVSGTLAFIKNTWTKFAPGYPLDYVFMDESYGRMYQAEEKLASLLWLFTMMAIVVACMGLFALAALGAEQRTKEIGIRKVLGASVLTIVGLLSWSFLRLVLLAALIAFPIAWWVANSWLKDFPYRVGVSWWVFGIAAAVAAGIALLTVSFQSIRAATANPVKSLRSE